MMGYIWNQGRLRPKKKLAIPLGDRALEHGLGLFETMRTWGGLTPLLDRHLDRLCTSARVLGIDLDPTSLPDAMAVSAMLLENGLREDVRLRINATGSGVVWLDFEWLSTAKSKVGATLVPAPWPIVFDDPLARHKSLNYWSRRMAYDAARSQGADEALFSTPDGRVWEGSRTNLFLIRDGTLWTPGLDGPIVPGIMRGLVLELAPALGLSILEGDLAGGDLDTAEEVFLTNAVRGIMPVAQVAGRVFMPPGPWTRRLHDEVVEWLQHEGVRP